jgi:hypothetical protein
MNEPIKEVGKEPISPPILKNWQRNNNKSKRRHVHGRAGKHRGTKRKGR